jgi:hypothetical protein
LFLPARLAVDMLKEVGIDLVGDAAIRFMRRPHGLGWGGFSWAGRVLADPSRSRSV